MTELTFLKELMLKRQANLKSMKFFTTSIFQKFASNFNQMSTTDNHYLLMMSMNLSSEAINLM